MDTMATTAEDGNEENTEEASKARVDPDALSGNVSDKQGLVKFNDPQTRVAHNGMSNNELDGALKTP